MLVRDAIDEFAIAMRQAGRSEVTVRQYKWHLRKMADWLTERGGEQLEEISRTLLREWGAALHGWWGSATIKQAVCAARAFFAWCREERIIRADPGRALKVPTVKERIQRTLTADEVQALVNACDLETVAGLRYQAMISLLVDSGLRAAELCRLRMADVVLDAGLLTVIGKGGDEEMVPFGNITVQRLQAWLDVRSAAEGVETVFVSLGGLTPRQPLTTSGLRNILRRLGKKAGVEGVSPHAFRRAFACISTEAGAPSRVVQKIGRWSDIRMVERYTMALQARRLYKQYSPADFVEKRDQKDGTRT
ncbi:MAG: tyrosine-type recombinase/integrase [Chloroflexi bacterium]|nr:tyrosine-type recombinase/integrase [Chloroflexota bacterium]